MVRTLFSNKESYTLSKEELEKLEKEIDLNEMLEILKENKAVPPKSFWEDIKFYKPKPSNECEDGYSGRIGIHEILKMSESIKSLIITNATSDEIEKQARKEGMLTMFQDGIIKAAQGITTIEEIFRVTSE